MLREIYIYVRYTHTYTCISFFVIVLLSMLADAWRQIINIGQKLRKVWKRSALFRAPLRPLQGTAPQAGRKPQDMCRMMWRKVSMLATQPLPPVCCSSLMYEKHPLVMPDRDPLVHWGTFLQADLLYWKGALLSIKKDPLYWKGRLLSIKKKPLY